VYSNQSSSARDGRAFVLDLLLILRDADSASSGVKSITPSSTSVEPLKQHLLVARVGKLKKSPPPLFNDWPNLSAGDIAHWCPSDFPEASSLFAFLNAPKRLSSG
jgi:hypothetical protein